MPLDIELYKSRLNAYKTGKDGSIDLMKKQIKDSFFSSPSCFDVRINDEDRSVHIVDENALKTSPNKKQLLCYPDESISVGDVVAWKDTYWLCLNIDFNDVVQSKGIIQMCNNTLSWTDEYGEYSYPCIIENKLSRYQEMQEKKSLVLPDDVMTVFVQYNENTKKIKHQDRFLFYGYAFEVQVIDNISAVYDDRGYISMIVKQMPLSNSEITGDSTIDNSEWNW